MPSKIEKLIAEWRAVAEVLDDGTEVTLCARLAYFERMCADELDRAYREEVVPLVEALRDIRDYWNMDKNEKAMGDALDHIVEVSEGALAVFDAPAPEEPK